MGKCPRPQAASQYFHTFASVQGVALEKMAAGVANFYGGAARRGVAVI